jgi:hypothetical protein
MSNVDHRVTVWHLTISLHQQFLSPVDPMQQLLAKKFNFFLRTMKTVEPVTFGTNRLSLDMTEYSSTELTCTGPSYSKGNLALNHSVKSN